MTVDISSVSYSDITKTVHSIWNTHIKIWGDWVIVKRKSFVVEIYMRSNSEIRISFSCSDIQARLPSISEWVDTPDKACNFTIKWLSLHEHNDSTLGENIEN